MSRRIVLTLFLVSTTMAMNQPSVDTYLNNRMIKLYNAKDFSTLAKELYHENAIVMIAKHSVTASGHDQIEALLRNTAFGRIESIEIIRSDEDPANNAFNVVAIMDYRMADGRQVFYKLQERIINGKFNSLIQSHIEKKI